MFASVLGWIPILGPIINGIVSIFVKSQDTVVAKYKVDGTVDVQALQSSAAITIAAQDDIGVRLSRDLVMFPGSCWCALYLWDKIVAHHWPMLVFDVAPLDGPLTVLPMALLTFFFGMSAMGIWRR